MANQYYQGLGCKYPTETKKQQHYSQPGQDVCGDEFETMTTVEICTMTYDMQYGGHRSFMQLQRILCQINLLLKLPDDAIPPPS